MKKNLKIVSSIALAGMLATNVVGTASLAATTENQTKTAPVGVYNKLINGKKVVPFVLASRNDSVTIKDIKDKFDITKFNGVSVPDENTVVGTGDTFTSNGEVYTVVVYGDVDGNGIIDVMDALSTEEHITGITKLDAIKEEAADVVNDGNIDVLDSLAIKEYVVELTDTIIDKLPEKEEEVVNSNYTITVNENGMINRQNEKSTTLNVKVAKTLDKEATYTIKAKGIDNEEKVIGTATIPAHTDFVKIENIDLSSFKDGAVTLTFVEGDKAVAKVETTKNTVAPADTNVTTKRVSTKQATLSLEKCGESDITKVHYLVQGVDEAAETDITKLTGEIAVSNNTVKEASVATDLETAKAYKVTYVLENAYGSMSEVKTVVIAKDDANVKAEEKVEKVNTPDLSKTETAEFTWTAKSGKTYVATLYKDGKAVKSMDVTAGTVDFTTDMQEVGKYKVSVFVKGAQDGTSTNSETTTSEEVEITKLTAVTDLKVENEKENIKLSWTNSQAKDDFNSYKIDLYTINEDGEEELNRTVVAPENDKNEVNFAINANTMYIAKVSLIAKDGQMAVLDSDITESKEFYRVSAPVITANTDIGTNYATLEITPIQINNKKVSYKVKIYDVKEDNDATEARYTLKTTKSVEVKDGKITVDGLESMRAYAFKIVANVDGKEVESDYSSELKTLPEIKNVTVAKVEDAEKANSGKVAVDGTAIIVNGYSLNRTDYAGVTSDKIDKEYKIIEALEEGDTLSISEDINSITVKLDGGASAQIAERDFSSIDLSKATVSVESNNFSKTIKGTFKELQLLGTESIFTLTDAQAEKITLSNGVEVQGNKDYTLNANASATINKVKVSTQKETDINAIGSDLVIEANKEANNLVFENKTETATITFNGLGDNTSEQSGTITIKSNGGKVTVASNKVNVSSKLNIEVNNGDVDISEESLTGDKNITVAKDANTTIHANAKTKAPVALTNVEAKDYTDEEIKNLFGENVVVAQVREYINSFGINGKGAKITVAKDSTDVTITFEKAVDTTSVSNIK